MQPGLSPSLPIVSLTKYLLVPVLCPVLSAWGVSVNNAGKTVVCMVFTLGCAEKLRHTSLRRPDLIKNWKGHQPSNSLSLRTTFVIRVF